MRIGLTESAQPLRIVQWATGYVGMHTLKKVIEHPKLDLVGLYVFSANKEGLDAGELCGLAPTGVKATRSIDEIVALKPDCVHRGGDRGVSRVPALRSRIDHHRPDRPSRRRPVRPGPVADAAGESEVVTTDLSGGLDPDHEFFLVEQPSDPGLRDSASFWVYDDAGVIGFPRIGVEAVASNWTDHQYQLNIAFADGRVLRIRDKGPRHSPFGSDGKPSVLGAGPLEFRCVKPFELLTATYDGTAVDTSTEALLRGDSGGPSVKVEFHIEATMAAPPWANGTLSADAAEQLGKDAEGAFMGGMRYEQLFRATGVLTVSGDEYRFTGGGTRVRRQGTREMAGFWGHCQQSAVFPSGRGFGYIAYRPRPDGTGSYNEGYVFNGDGHLVPARVLRAPWLDAPPAIGEDVSLVLESELGTVEIGGTTVVSVFNLGDPASSNALAALHQGGVRYTWDGETACGAIERSTPPRDIPGLAFAGQ